MTSISLPDNFIFLAFVFFILFRFLTSFVLPFLKIFFNHVFLYKLFTIRHKLNKFGSWAIVTGATDGIGLAYSSALARQGLNIVLVSRSADKLDSVSKNIEKSFSVKTIKIAVDFTKVDIYDTISERVRELDVGVLVNNVGMGHPMFGVCHLDNYAEVINCNLLSAVQMTKIILPGMTARGKGGAIINISSGTGARPYPLLSVYSSTKVFVDFFSCGLHRELQSQRIHVQSVLPYYVATKMIRLKTSLFIPKPNDFVNSALNMLGVESRTFGCLTHSLQELVVSLLPEKLHQFVVWHFLKSRSS